LPISILLLLTLNYRFAYNFVKEIHIVGRKIQREIRKERERRKIEKE